MTRSRENAARPVGQRWALAICVLAVFATVALLDRVLLPGALERFEALELTLPAAATFAVAAADLFRAYWWAFGTVAAVVIGLALGGVLDRVLKPSIALAALALLIVAGSTVSTWNADRAVVQQLEAE